MLPLVDLRGRDLTAPGVLSDALAPPAADPAPVDAVRDIIAAVRERGDAALRELTARFDGCDINDLRVPTVRVTEALGAIEPALRTALEFARDQIDAYHRSDHGQASPSGAPHEREGIRVRTLVRPVAAAGLYVPGGRAAYPSTVLMTAIPARVAGVGRIALCVPPDAEGNPPLATLAAAALAGVDEVYRVGGAQAIAALAYGTETMAPVDVVVGPGNAFVTEAKRQVIGQVGVEALAGPSELVVIVDDDTPVDWAAIDLVAQAEHGPGGKAVVVTWSESVARAISSRVPELAAESPRREEVESTLRAGGTVFLVDGPETALTVANWVAPEHLQLMTADADSLVDGVTNAGAVFVGPWAPAPVGDYVAGVNHVLPTARTARFAGALRVAHFLKHTHVVSLDGGALAAVEPHVSALAEAEGLPAHGLAVRMRKPGEEETA